MDSPLQNILETLALSVAPGQTTYVLEEMAAALLRIHKVEPAFLGYKPQGAPGPYPNVLCISLNNEVIHGIPSHERKIEFGDVVKLDLGLIKDGEFDDGALTVIAGGEKAGSSLARRLVRCTKEALEKGLLQAKAGHTTHDIARVVSAVAIREGFGIVKRYCGHGIGKELHLPPSVYNEIVPGEPAVKLEAGQRICIEPMFVTKENGVVVTAPNGWTVKLPGGGLAAHFEKSILIR